MADRITPTWVYPPGYIGALRIRGYAEWKCPHLHDSPEDAKKCAQEELRRRRATETKEGK